MVKSVGVDFAYLSFVLLSEEYDLGVKMRGEAQGEG
jgi:hypothetical protein